MKTYSKLSELEFPEINLGKNQISNLFNEFYKEKDPLFINAYNIATQLYKWNLIDNNYDVKITAKQFQMLCDIALKMELSDFLSENPLSERIETGDIDYYERPIEALTIYDDLDENTKNKFENFLLEKELNDLNSTFFRHDIEHIANPFYEKELLYINNDKKEIYISESRNSNEIIEIAKNIEKLNYNPTFKNEKYKLCLPSEKVIDFFYLIATMLKNYETLDINISIPKTNSMEVSIGENLVHLISSENILNEKLILDYFKNFEKNLKQITLTNPNFSFGKKGEKAQFFLSPNCYTFFKTGNYIEKEFSFEKIKEISKYINKNVRIVLPEGDIFYNKEKNQLEITQKFSDFFRPHENQVNESNFYNNSYILELANKLRNEEMKYKSLIKEINDDSGKERNKCKYFDSLIVNGNFEPFTGKGIKKEAKSDDALERIYEYYKLKEDSKKEIVKNSRLNEKEIEAIYNKARKISNFRE